VILLAFGCAPPAPPEPTVSSPCREAFVPAPGPLAEEAAALTDPVALGQLRLREARLSGDPGFYELADLAARCRLDQDPADPAAVALHAEVLVQFHRFAEAEELLAPLAEASGDWRHLLLLGDARVDQGGSRRRRGGVVAGLVAAAGAPAGRPLRGPGVAAR
jgi:hypothetical protein